MRFGGFGFNKQFGFNAPTVTAVTVPGETDVLLLSGDMTDGDDYLLLSGDMQSGVDGLKLSGSF